MPVTRDAVARADVFGPEEPLAAVTYDRPPPEVLLSPGMGSAANPHAFVCSDHFTYWVKRDAQRGLGVELIAGRLANMIGTGSVARAVFVPGEALPAAGTARDLLGLRVGFRDEPDMYATKHLDLFVQHGVTFPLDSIDEVDYVLTMAFRGWIGCGDDQALLNNKTGAVRSVDYGDAFDPGALASPIQLRPINIPGVPQTLGKNQRVADRVVARFTGVTDDQIVSSVSGFPVDADWAMTVESRLDVGVALARRRDMIEEVMHQWLA